MLQISLDKAIFILILMIVGTYKIGIQKLINKYQTLKGFTMEWNIFLNIYIVMD